jgi:hypothetical protein
MNNMPVSGRSSETSSHPIDNNVYYFYDIGQHVRGEWEAYFLRI